MSQKIVLVFPFIDDEKEHHHIPLSTLSVSAPLQRLGVEFEIFDQRVEAPERLDALIEDAFLLGVTMFTGFQTHCGYEILKKAKKARPGIITVAGGPHVTALPAQAAEDENIDYAVAGFGEAPFYELMVELLERGHVNGHHIPGLYHKAQSELCFTPTTRKFDGEFWDPLPYEKIDINNYINAATNRVMYVAHYGCPARCTFCATTHYRKWTPKPIEFIEKDLEQLYAHFPFEEMCFFDATLFTRKDRVGAVIDCLDPYPGTRWMADARAVELNKYSTDDLIEIRDKKAELQFLIVGLESGSPYIAEEVMKKGKKHLDMFRTVAHRMHEAEIQMMSGLIFGIPGETTEDLKKTIDYIWEIRDIHPAFKLSSTFFRPLPGTELYDVVEKQGFIPQKNLAEWAAVGKTSHFKYNEWMDIPWMEEGEKARYRKLYDEFTDQHADILE
jgi:anaerobic magnesium-protoporphyrin IX monomethyl ester cyclase